MCTAVHTKSGNCSSAYTKCHLQYPIKRLILLFIQRLLISIVECNSFDCQMCIVLSTNAASDRAYRKFEMKIIYTNTPDGSSDKALDKI